MLAWGVGGGEVREGGREGGIPRPQRESVVDEFDYICGTVGFA